MFFHQKLYFLHFQFHTFSTLFVWWERLTLCPFSYICVFLRHIYIGHIARHNEYQMKALKANLVPLWIWTYSRCTYACARIKATYQFEWCCRWSTSSCVINTLALLPLDVQGPFWRCVCVWYPAYAAAQRFCYGFFVQRLICQLTENFLCFSHLKKCLSCTTLAKKKCNCTQIHNWNELYFSSNCTCLFLKWLRLKENLSQLIYSRQNPFY
jgi:hypothetical protein